MPIPTETNQGLPPLRKIIIIGNGGRENSLAWALSKNENIEKILISPGNAGSEFNKKCLCLNLGGTHSHSLIDLCLTQKIDLVIIGPEAPLAEGLADQLRNAGITVFGPGKKGALLESSKAWAKDLMKEYGIPTAKHWTVTTEKEGIAVVKKYQQPLVVKADGLASGKGVAVSESIEETIQSIKEAFNGRFGSAGSKVVLEERIEGPEVSVFAITDGEKMILLPPAQDHKRIHEGDCGPNTGGMGAYAPAPLLDKKGLEEVRKSILEPTLSALRERGVIYKGVIYAGLMLTSDGPKVIEFNCRFGDPECQALMPLLGNQLGEVLQASALGCLDKAPKLEILDRVSACVVASSSGYPENPRRNDPITINLEERHNLQVFHAGTERDKNGTLLTSGGRILAVVAEAKTFEEAFNVAYEGMRKIHYNGIHYRRDIGHQVRPSLTSKTRFN